MVIKKKIFYAFLFAIIIFAQLYVESFRFNIVIQILALCIYFFLEKPILPKSLLKTLLPFVIIFVIGFIGFFFHEYLVFNLIKDIFHFLKPILGLSIGYLFFSKINNFPEFVKTIVFVGLFSAVLHLLVLIISGNLFSGSIPTIRMYSKDNFLELFAIFFLFFYKKFEGNSLFEKKITQRLILIILLISCVLYFSRTMIIVSAILFASIKGYTLLTIKAIQRISVFIGAVIVLYIYLYSIKIDRNAEGLENFLFKIKNAPEELFVTKIDRTNHKDLWDHWRGYEVKCAFDLMQTQPTSYIIGTGHGSLVNLRFKAPLTGGQRENDGLKFISELHNGYVYIFYKTGIIGLTIALAFLFFIYNFINKHVVKKRFIAVFISAIGLIFLFTTLTITGIYNSRDIIIFILGGLLFFHNKEYSVLNHRNE